MKKLRVGLAGLGTVGKSVYEILQNDAKSLSDKHNTEFEVVAVSARSKKDFVADNVKFYSNAVDIAQDSEVDVVIEMIGGNDIAKDLAFESLKNKKHLITANKALLAEHGYEIAQLADANNLHIGYEASTAGAIPVIKSFKDNFAAANDIKEFYGILNGTCNFILTKMESEGLAFADVLKQAQEKGYAEADPTFDIKGFDAAHKLTILSTIASKTKPAFKELHIEGVDEIEISDINLANELGYKIKLLAIYKNNEGEIEQALYPALVDNASMISKIDGTYNTILTNCSNANWNMLIGHGAGGLITASAIVADLTDIANDHFSKIFLHDASKLVDGQIKNISDRVGDYFIKLIVNKDTVAQDREFMQSLFDNKFEISKASYIDNGDEIIAGFIIKSQKESDIDSFIQSISDDKVKSVKFIRVENPQF